MSTTTAEELLDKKVNDLELDEEEEEEDNKNNNVIELSDSMIEPPPKSKCETINLEDMRPEDRDEEMEDFARQFKSIYEKKFVEHLKSLKQGEPLNATSLPEKKYNKDTYEEDSANSTTILFYFEKLDVDEKGNVNAVLTKSFDKTEICHFQPFLCKEYGPYYDTNLYCCMYNTGRAGSDKALNFFLDLPIDLYNLIE